MCVNASGELLVGMIRACEAGRRGDVELEGGVGASFGRHEARPAEMSPKTAMSATAQLRSPPPSIIAVYVAVRPPG